MAMAQEVAEWLASRGISQEIAGRYGLRGRVEKGEPILETPFFLNGEEVNVKSRKVKTKEFFQKSGGRQCFWNADAITGEQFYQEPVIITEGEMDALAALQSGYKRAVSVPGGAPERPVGADSVKYDFLEDVFHHLRHNAPFVILATDDDERGRVLRHDLAIRIGRDVCKWVRYPKGCKDLNDALMRYGERAIVETINRAQWMKVDGVARLTDIPIPPKREIVTPNMGGLGKRMKLRMGDFSVVTGIPNHGKSTFVRDLCCRLAMDRNLNITFASFEHEPHGDQSEDLRHWYLGKPPETWEDRDIAAADDWISRKMSFIYPTEYQEETDELDLGWLLEKCSAAVKRFNTNIIVIDPWNEIEHKKSRDQTMTEYIGQSLRTIKQFARIFNVHVIIVAHPTKQKELDDGSFQKPTLYSIADSASWYSKAYIGMVVHRDKHETIVDVQKVKKIPLLGIGGETRFIFNQYTHRFEES